MRNYYIYLVNETVYILAERSLVVGLVESKAEKSQTVRLD